MKSILDHMKYKKTLLLSVMFIAVSCYKQNHKQVWFYDSDNLEKLNGDVKQLHSETRFNVFNLNFDKTGCIIRSTQKSLDIVTTAGSTDTTITKLNSDYVIVPDPKSDQTNFIVNNNGTESFKSKWVLDKHNYILRFVFSVSNEENSDFYMYKYNAKGDLSTSIYIIQSLEDTLKNQYEYDSMHNLIQSCSYDSGRLLKDVHYKYLKFDEKKIG